MTNSAPSKTDSMQTSGARRRLGPWDYVVLLLVLAIVCFLYEYLRMHFPRDRRSFFVVATLLHHAVVLASLGVLWHRFLGWLFRGPASTLAWGIPLLTLLAVCVLGLINAASSGGTGAAVARTVLRFAFNEVVLSLYVYLGLYGRWFLALILAVGAFLLGTHWCSHNWRSKGWVHARAARAIKRYLELHPDGAFSLALRAIHWEAFGHVAVDDQYESKLKELVSGQRAAFHQERLARFRAKLAVPDRRSTAHASKRQRRHCYMANMACCLTAPVADAAMFAARLVDAAEIYYELQLAALPSGNSQTSGRAGLADSISAAKVFEKHAYERLLGQLQLKPHPSRENLPYRWRQTLTCYRWACLRWQTLPDWLRAWFVLDDAVAYTSVWQLPTCQAKLVRFLINPSDKIEELQDALTVAKTPAKSGSGEIRSIVLDASLVERLAWLAVAKWMSQIEQQGPLYHEALIDGFTRLRCAGLPLKFWGVETTFELGIARHWARTQCAMTLGTAWLVQWHLLTGIRGNEDVCEFAYRQAKSNLAAGNAESLLSAVSQRHEVDPCPVPMANVS